MSRWVAQVRRYRRHLPMSDCWQIFPLIIVPQAITILDMVVIVELSNQRDRNPFSASTSSGEPRGLSK